MKKLVNPFFSLLVSVLSGSTRRKVKYWRLDAIVSYIFPLIDVEEAKISTILNEVIIANIVVEKTMDTDIARTSVKLDSFEIKTPIVTVGDATIPNVNFYLNKENVTTYVLLNSVVISTPVKELSLDALAEENVTTSVTLSNVVINQPVRASELTTSNASTTVILNSVEIL